MLEHGGGLRLAAAQRGIPLDEWLDLSTGINPDSWPVPEVPAAIWSRLPEDDDGLEQAARLYYNAEAILPVAGSQAAIQALPALRSSCNVGVLTPGYAEHAHAWQRAGHRVSALAVEAIETALSQLDVLIIINPNNPTGAGFSIEQLLRWHQQLADRGGWLVVDEAFIDVTPEQSLTLYSTRTGLIVLRSLGKFFGLAGARLGFVCAQAELLAQLKSLLGPWTINAPTRWLAKAALADTQWQQATRKRLCNDAVRLYDLLAQYELEPDGGCALFQWVKTPQATFIYENFAASGVLIRLFSNTSSLRFGLPGSESDWQRLTLALMKLTEAQVETGHEIKTLVVEAGA